MLLRHTLGAAYSRWRCHVIHWWAVSTCLQTIQFPQPKSQVYKRKKPTTKGVLRNRAIKYERETLLVCLFKQKRGGCTCKGRFWLMWHELPHLKTDTWNRCYSAEGFRHDSHSQAHVPRKRALGFCYSVSTDTRTIIQRTTDRLVTKTANQCLFAYHSLHF